MKRFVFFVLLFFPLLVFPSELRVFKDGCVYYPDNKNPFVGFNRADVFCDGVKVRVFPFNGVLNEKCYLKDFYNRALSLSGKIEVLNKEKSFLNNVERGLKFGSYQDTVSAFKNARYFAKTYFEIEKKIKELSLKLKRLNGILSSCAVSKHPFFASLPASFNSYRIEFKGIDFKTENLFYYDANSKKGRVLKDLVMVNRSGIDLKCDSVYLMNFSSRRSFYPYQFAPWEITEGKAYEEEYSSSRMLSAAPPMKKKAINKLSREKISISQIDSRVYLLQNVMLPSDGKEKRFKLFSSIVSVSSRLVVYPRRDTTVYREYSFNLPFEIDSDQWKVYSGKEVYDNVQGAFRDKKYRIFAGVDYSIRVDRKDIVNFEKKEGFFKTKKTLKDGYEIVLRNIGKKNKEVSVIDAIPISTNADIRVRDVKVTGVQKYRLSKKGKLEFKVDLKPGQIKRIKVVFVIEYPEDAEIYY